MTIGVDLDETPKQTVIVVPGLYYVFGKLAEGRKLIRDEDERPLTEDVVHHG